MLFSASRLIRVVFFRSILFVLAFAAAAPLSLRADGPGIANLTYATNELFSTLAMFTSTNSAPRGHGFVAMHHGYLVLIFSNDGGGGAGSGGFTFFNVANPRLPVPT